MQLNTLRRKYRFLPKDFIETEDGLLFAVLGFGEEESRLIVQLRYMRSAGRFQKMNTKQAAETLSEKHPDWLLHCRQRDASIQAVPVNEVATHFRPESKLQSIRQQHPQSLISRACCLLDIDYSCDIGITGSHLIGAADEKSDVDLVLYQKSSFATAQQNLREAMERDANLRLSQETWNSSFHRRGCSLGFDSYVWHERRKFNKFVLDGTKVDLSYLAEPPTWLASPATKQGTITVQTRVTEDSRAFESPAIYRVEHSEIDVIVCFTPTFAGQAVAGESICARGFLEHAQDGTRRLIVGSSREGTGEYIVAAEQFCSSLPGYTDLKLKEDE